MKENTEDQHAFSDTQEYGANRASEYRLNECVVGEELWPSPKDSLRFQSGAHIQSLFGEFSNLFITVSVWCELRLVSAYRGRGSELGRGRNP